MSVFEYTAGSRKFTRTRKSLKKFSFTTTDAVDISNTFVKAKAGVLAIKALNEHAFYDKSMHFDKRLL